MIELEEVSALSGEEVGGMLLEVLEALRLTVNEVTVLKFVVLLRVFKEVYSKKADFGIV